MRVDTTPYQEVTAHDLALWLEQTSREGDWLVDGDSLLTSRLDFPAPTDELAKELRLLGGSLFVRAPHTVPKDVGKLIGPKELNDLVVDVRGRPIGDEGSNRALYLRWKDYDELVEWGLWEYFEDDE